MKQDTKFDNEEETVDMSVLPPCESVLQLHCERGNFLAAIWKKAIDIFPQEIESILLGSRYDSEDVDDTLRESDDEELPGEWCYYLSAHYVLALCFPL